MREGRDRPGKKNCYCFFRCCWGEGKWGADPQNSNHCLPQLLPVAVQIETGQTGDWHSAMPHTSPKWAGLPAPATAGNHQPGLSVKAALETWRQRITFLSWSNIFPKISVLVQGFMLLKLYGDTGPSSGRSTTHIVSYPFQPPPLELALLTCCKGNSTFLKGNGWFYFLIYESTFDCKLFVHGTEHRGPNPHQSPWVCAFTTGTNENSDCVRYILIKPRCCWRMLILPSLCSALSSKTKIIAHNNLSFRLLKARHS